MTLGPWPVSPPLVKGSTTWAPTYQQWLSRLVEEVNLDPPATFATLPRTPTIGQLAIVSDSSTAAWGAVIAGGGANQVLAFWNGTAWKVLGT